MRHISIAVTLVLILFLTAISTSAETTNETFVKDNIALFDQIFAVLSMTNGVYQTSYLTHIGISDVGQPIMVKVLSDFQTQQDTLKQDAEKALSQKDAASATALADVRTRRTELLIQSATELFLKLDIKSSTQLKSYITKIAASMPKTTTAR